MTEVQEVKACVNCGLEKNIDEFNKRKNSPDGHRGQCRPCLREVQREYNASHRDQINATGRAWSAKNPEKVLGKYQKQLARNAERVRLLKRLHADKWRKENPGYGRQWQKENRERRNEQARARRAANPEKYREIAKARYARCKALGKKVSDWPDRNKEAVRAITRNYRCKKRNGGQHTGEQIKKLCHKQKKRCICCLASLAKGYHADHIMPISKGGANTIDNIQLLCPRCNLEKHAKDPFQYMQSKGYLL